MCKADHKTFRTVCALGKSNSEILRPSNYFKIELFHAQIMSGRKIDRSRIRRSHNVPHTKCPIRNRSQKGTRGLFQIEKAEPA